jgi:hypothetical protein
MSAGRAWGLVAAVALFGVAPFVTPPFRGYDPALFPLPAAVADPAIQPAGYAFAIWSVIYAGLGAHALFGALRRREEAGWDAPRLPLAAAAVMGAGWLSLAPVAPVAATVLIWAMAGAATLALARAGRGAPGWLCAGPPALLAGWLLAAATVSTGVVLAGYGVTGNAGGALVLIPLAALAALAGLARLPCPAAYGAAIAWALAGIAVANGGAGRPGVATLAALAAAGVAAAALWRARRRGAA